MIRIVSIWDVYKWQLLNFKIIPPLLYDYNEGGIILGKIEDMQKIILVMRQELQDLINEKSDLLHPEVIAASQKLDQALNNYNDILKELKK